MATQTTAAIAAQYVFGLRFNGYTGEHEHGRWIVTDGSPRIIRRLQMIKAEQLGRVPHRQLTILFTDLVDHADWALRAGDTLAFHLLCTVGQTVEPAVVGHGGRVVKRLGDGLMAVFSDPGAGVDAALKATEAVHDLDVAGYRPTLRAGLHTGRPRKFGDDYLGVDVNIAARIADAARPGEVLVSDSVRPHLDADELAVRTRRRFAAKGAPRDLKVHAVRRQH